MGRNTSTVLCDARLLVDELQAALDEKLRDAQAIAEELQEQLPPQHYDPGEVAIPQKTELFDVLHDVGVIVTDFCARLAEQVDEAETTFGSKQDDESSLRQHISVMARRCEDLSDRQQEYVRVIKDLKRAHDDEIAVHKRELAFWKREALEARATREQQVHQLREARLRDLRDAREHVRALESVHRLAKEDMVKLCSSGVASIANQALEVAVAGHNIKLEDAEMVDIVWNALHDDINGKLEAWTKQYCGSKERQRPPGQPPIRRSSSGPLPPCLRKQVSMSSSSNSSFSSGTSGDASPPNAGLPRPFMTPRSLLSTAPISLNKLGSRTSSSSSEILPASPVKSRPLSRTTSRSGVLLKARFEGVAAA